MSTRHRFSAAVLSAAITWVMLVGIDTQATVGAPAQQLAATPTAARV